MSGGNQSEPPRFPPWMPGGGPVHSSNAHGKKAQLASEAQGKWVKPETTVRLATHRLADINNQLHEGRVEVNIGAMSPSDVLAFVERLSGHARRLTSLRLIVMPRGIGYSQYTYDAQQDPRAVRGQILLSEWHRDGVDLASATVQNKRCRTVLYSSLLKVLLTSDIAELEIGMRLTPAGYKTLSSGLARNVTLKKLSFRGSHMTDGLLALLKPGLELNNSIEVLDLTACSLSDRSATLLASIVKSHTERRIMLGFHDHLRTYPDQSLAPRDSELQHRRDLQRLAKGVDEQCGGFVHLELAENSITDRGVSDLCVSLSFDRRLAMLGLRSNKITQSSEEKVIELMKDHRALARVDLRQNGAKKDNLGILKLARPTLSRPFYSALGYHRMNQKALPSPLKTNASILLEQLDVPPSLSSSPGHLKGVKKEDQHERYEEGLSSEASPLHMKLSAATGDDDDEEERTGKADDAPFLTRLASLPTNQAVFEDEGEGRTQQHNFEIDQVPQHSDMASATMTETTKGRKVERTGKKIVRRKRKKIQAALRIKVEPVTDDKEGHRSSLGMIQEIAAIFRDLEIKVSSLKLFHELKRGAKAQEAAAAHAAAANHLGSRRRHQDD